MSFSTDIEIADHESIAIYVVPSSNLWTKYPSTKVVLIRLGIYVFVNKARGGGSPKFFINTL
jgi:hypothetical protein